jgi:hypothetical protein
MYDISSLSTQAILLREVEMEVSGHVARYGKIEYVQICVICEVTSRYSSHCVYRHSKPIRATVYDMT